MGLTIDYARQARKLALNERKNFLLSLNERKNFLLSLNETALYEDLATLFERMDPADAVEITHGCVGLKNDSGRIR